MKLLRFIHFSFGVLAVSILLSIPWMLISAHFQSVEMAREGAVENSGQRQLLFSFATIIICQWSGG